MSSAERDLQAGRILGAWRGGAAGFLGIPYGRPLTGEARFAPPDTDVGWEGVFDATAFGPSPPQAPAPPVPEGADPDDYLRINVWTPDPDASGLPVIVYFHGGGYVTGSSADPSFDGTALARDENLVIVSMNHRLGMDGFALVDGAPANRGLLDQAAALRWVRDNVAAFGGDPGNVTLYGQSAGAGCVAALVTMPWMRGLFRRVILSSLPNAYQSPERARQVASDVATRAGTRPTAADLARVPVDVLVTAVAEGLARNGPAPVVDGEVLLTDPWTAFGDGLLDDVPMMIGHTADEYRLFVARGGLLGRVSTVEADHALKALAPGSPDAYRTAYPDASCEELYDLVVGDALFRMGTYRLAELHEGTTFLYELTFTVPAYGGRLGAPHSSDLPLVFDVFDEGVGAELYGGDPSAEARELGVEMRRAWGDFARGGDPGWLPFDQDRRLTRVFDDQLSEVRYPEEASRRIWAEHRFGPLPAI
ncbi:carboxylesterase/lipase family protein [Actinomadura harenae]|uniref:Carboxylic ester hydrolase n=1 Tax=Actinomadura harenae TaxID=2483351 RepID=A0A3M2LZW2_9ACTN|nr:carboxylesterase family protein [Actinomadura harenae]RMI43034.1 carboxylesterase/lipase family protein [Actinomadura harenae]